MGGLMVDYENGTLFGRIANFFLSISMVILCDFHSSLPSGCYQNQNLKMTSIKSFN